MTAPGISQCESTTSESRACGGNCQSASGDDTETSASPWPTERPPEMGCGNASRKVAFERKYNNIVRSRRPDLPLFSI